MQCRVLHPSSLNIKAYEKLSRCKSEVLIGFYKDTYLVSAIDGMYFISVEQFSSKRRYWVGFYNPYSYLEDLITDLKHQILESNTVTEYLELLNQSKEVIAELKCL